MTFSGPPRLEDRRLRPITLSATNLTRQAGVTLWIGPHLLLANTDQPRPVLLGRVGQGGQLLLPAANRFPLTSRLDASEDQLKQPASASLALAPWESIRHEAAAAVVFDLIAQPAGD